MNDIKASIFENNLFFLSRKEPQLALSLKSANIPSNIRGFQTKSKHFSAEVILSSDCTRLLHSAIDPMEEAIEWAQMQDITAEAFALLGFGLGYPALALLEEDFQGKLYIVEKDIGIFKLAAIHCDLTKLFTSDNVDLFIGKDADYFLYFLNKNTTSLHYKIYQPAAILHQQFYKDVSLSLDKIIFEQHKTNDPQTSSILEEALMEMKI